MEKFQLLLCYPWDLARGGGLYAQFDTGQCTVSRLSLSLLAQNLYSVDRYPLTHDQVNG